MALQLSSGIKTTVALCAIGLFTKGLQLFIASKSTVATSPVHQALIDAEKTYKAAKAAFEVAKARNTGSYETEKRMYAAYEALMEAETNYHVAKGVFNKYAAVDSGLKNDLDNDVESD